VVQKSFNPDSRILILPAFQFKQHPDIFHIFGSSCCLLHFNQIIQVHKKRRRISQSIFYAVLPDLFLTFSALAFSGSIKMSISKVAHA